MAGQEGPRAGLLISWQVLTGTRTLCGLVEGLAMQVPHTGNNREWLEQPGWRSGVGEMLSSHPPAAGWGLLPFP